MEAAARRYAKAIFELAVEANSVDKVTEELRTIGETIRGHAELKSVLSNPTIAPEARKAVLEGVLGKLGVSPLVKHTLLLVADHRRTEIIPQMADVVQELGDVRAGKIRAEVTSAQALTDQQAQRIAAALEKLTGRKVSLKRSVDPALIGGVITRVGDKVFDGSVRSRLVAVRQALLPS